MQRTFRIVVAVVAEIPEGFDSLDGRNNDVLAEAVSASIGCCGKIALPVTEEQMASGVWPDPNTPVAMTIEEIEETTGL